jgi:hypothetical protein
VRGSSIKWMSGCTKRQCDRTLPCTWHRNRGATQHTQCARSCGMPRRGGRGGRGVEQTTTTIAGVVHRVEAQMDHDKELDEENWLWTREENIWPREKHGKQKRGGHGKQHHFSLWPFFARHHCRSRAFCAQTRCATPPPPPQPQPQPVAAQLGTVTLWKHLYLDSHHKPRARARARARALPFSTPGAVAVAGGRRALGAGGGGGDWRMAVGGGGRRRLGCTWASGASVAWTFPLPVYTNAPCRGGGDFP